MESPDRLQTLPEIEAAVWRELVRAARVKQHAWRTAVLASVADSAGGADGDNNAADAGSASGSSRAAGPVPEARTVVLREVDAAARYLVIFSDARAGKVAQLAARPQGLIVMWSAALNWQLRLRVSVEVHVDGLAVTSRWATLRASPAARDYLAPSAPGEVLDPQAAAPLIGTEREHFAVLMARVQAIDWLELHPAGHRRAGFDAMGSRWLAP